MSKTIEHDMRSCHISRINFFNGANNITNLSFTKTSFTKKGKTNHPKFNNANTTARLTPLQNESFNLTTDLCLSDGQEFTMEVEIISGSEKKSHAYYFIYSNFSDAYVSIDTSKNSCTLMNTEYDHYSNHVKRIILENKGAYVAKFRIHFYNVATKKWDSKDSGKFAVGKSKYWDGIEELKLPNNSIMYPEVCAVWGKNKKCNSKYYYVRQDSKKVVKYRCKGTTLKPSISEA